jgi:hypothetical protein
MITGKTPKMGHLLSVRKTAEPSGKFCIQFCSALSFDTMSGSTVIKSVTNGIVINQALVDLGILQRSAGHHPVLGTHRQVEVQVVADGSEPFSAALSESISQRPLETVSVWDVPARLVSHRDVDGVVGAGYDVAYDEVLTEP